LRVLFAASECFPLIKTGGLADVVGSLPPALNDLGCDTRILLPGYPDVMAALDGARTLRAFEVLYGGKARILSGMAGNLSLFVLDAPHLFDRPGNPYTGADRRDWPDNHLRFAALSATAAMIAAGEAGKWRPAIVHAHDWQTGLVPVYVRRLGETRPKTVFTIHNIAYQGLFPPSAIADIGLGSEDFTPARVEFFGHLSLLKAGLVDADRITTVSPTYAREIRTPEFGFGFEGLLNARADDLTGILNGIDETVWNPANDPHLAAHFSKRSLDRRPANRDALQEAFGLARDPDAMVLAVVSRLVHQKGLDVLLQVVPQIVARGGQFVLLGSGEDALEHGFLELAQADPGRIGVRIGYDEPLSHQIYAGADALVIPSRFEPCGLTQLYALRYGAIPIVARTGGLADTIVDANAVAMRSGVATGLQFTAVDAETLGFAIERAFQLFADKSSWRLLQRRAMSQDVGWGSSAKEYLGMYDALAGARAD